MDSGFLIVSAAVLALILAFVIAAAVRPGKPGRHKGAYVPAKDRPTIGNATNHSATTDAVGPRSKRFPEMER
ncbi:hypothetical protein AB0N24_04465 [Arthrobacter sp. NPDC093128]|uniref:hypothetical protein n=1 Tax=Arthrobacter sp. NPDC093128 TaxID=3154979 RepID=UPI0034378331